MMDNEKIVSQILNNDTSLGIEFGSTRIKAVLIGTDNMPIASGGYDWENQYQRGVWTYDLDDIHKGLKCCYQNMKLDVLEKYGISLTSVGAIGISGMMHGYMAFNQEGKLLTPFRTWRNTNTGEAATILTREFCYNIPQRFSIAHLYQSILNREEHVQELCFFTTLAGYIHWQLTGEKVLGIGEASGMFPIDIEAGDFNSQMIARFDELVNHHNYKWLLRELLPEVLKAGEKAGILTPNGAKLLDPDGELKSGIPLCPPEGDAGTGMVATNTVAPRTANVSAGTSVFAMVVLERELRHAYEEIDMVTTPAGKLVAMVHCNNCTSDLNAWVNLFGEFADNLEMNIDKDRLFGMLYRKALEGDMDCGGLLAYNYFSGEHITGMKEGRPLFVRTPESHFNLANFMRVHLFTALGALKTGMNILQKEEAVGVDLILGHGGLFKTAEVGQRVMAGAMNTPVAVMKTAGEGGAWGIALLASYLKNKGNESLDTYLRESVFCGEDIYTIRPNEKDVTGYEQFMMRYTGGLEIESAAINGLK